MLGRLSAELLVQGVIEASPAHAAGRSVPLDARLVEIQGYPVESLDDVGLAVQRGGRSLEFVFVNQSAVPEGTPPDTVRAPKRRSPQPRCGHTTPLHLCQTPPAFSDRALPAGRKGHGANHRRGGGLLCGKRRSDRSDVLIRASFFF